MDLEYDQKFEEMKKYIPFLESMIRRLETTNKGVKNPRKAQLDKIRSLRDLLLDKKKRMKMENLLKCEQVLVNLYAKVEQRDSMADVQDVCCMDKKEKSDLNMVRNKLKSVVSKIQDDAPETLPEIARATNTEVVCTPGSKEPALFQRRPNKATPRSASTSSDTANKRHYTRVLMSPEREKKEWSTNSSTRTEPQLFSRRSPRTSPKRYSPSYKKERKKSSRQRSKSSQKSKDLNITLKVPEESLGSLNTKDILSRIINCSDNDVDIETLRGLRSQILGELKQTGSNDDISELILKSYKRDKNKDKKLKKKDDVEEGELSDSESEAIENIYGSLVVVNEDESNSNTKKVPNDKKKPRKIQICLVINSDKDKDTNVNDQKASNTIDISDFEAYTDPKTSSTGTSEKCDNNDKFAKEITIKQPNEQEHDNKILPVEVNKGSLRELEGEHKLSQKTDTKSEPIKSPAEQVTDISDRKLEHSSNDAFKPNFYKPSEEEHNKPEKSHENQTCKLSDEILESKKNETTISPNQVAKSCENIEAADSGAIIKPKKIVISEIDILQALKKEILGETPVIPISETVTPPLHQPKVTKVASASEIGPKKRISIEKYKQKSVTSIKQPLFKPKKKTSSSVKDDNSKKQSLKLTEKECERFNFPVNVSPVDSSDDENQEILRGDLAPKSLKENSSLDFDFLLDDSAPKSPDHDDFADTGIKPPVIIPSDPVKHIVASSKSDIDMRSFLLASPVDLEGSSKNMTLSLITSEKVSEVTWGRKGCNSEKISNSVSEFRNRKESKQPMPIGSPKSCVVDSDRKHGGSYQNVSSTMSSNITSTKTTLMSLNAPRMPTLSPNMVSAMNSVVTPILNQNIPLLLSPNMTQSMMPTMNPSLMSNIIPNMNPSMTPSRLVANMNPIITPIMTPNARSYEMTPRPNFDNDDYTNQKHVYAPMFSSFDFTEKDNLNMQAHRRESNESNKNIHKNEGFIADHLSESSQARMECPSTPNPAFGRMECPSTPNPSFGRMDCPPTPNASFGRMDCPPTLNLSFGRMDCPPTPNPSFGRMDCPPTPNPSFGRMDCPPTPNASFGRLECPSTPNPSFGRRETTPMTPHTFGRSDCPMTPSHSFGRADSNVASPNVFGRSEYLQYVNSHDPRLNRKSDYDKYQRRNEERNRSYYEDDRNVTDKYRSSGRSNRDNISLRREPSVGRSKECDDESYVCYNNDFYTRRERYTYNDDVNSRRDYCGRNLGRNNQDEEPTFTPRESSRNYLRDDSIEKPISVQSHSGRSFNIDTSFNRTFQETRSSSPSSLFDARRRRASSVGRSLRESPHKDFKAMSNNNKKIEIDIPDRKNMRFRRASSVGRELKDHNVSKNFNDIKEDLRSCKFNNYDKKLHDKSHKTKTQHSNSNEKIRSNELYGIQNKRVPYASTSHSAEHQNRDPRKVRDNNRNTNDFKYSPRQNYRDPRMRREIDNRPGSKDKHKERSSSSSRFKNHGIVYSNDNIARGTILASAAGVKNFKIPKLKRPNEEKEVENREKPSETDTKKEDSLKNMKKGETLCVNNEKKGDTKVSKSESISKDANIDKPKPKKETTSSVKLVDKANTPDNRDLADSVADNCDRRVTRSANKVVTPVKQISDTSPIRKLKRIKKPLIYDSDSDSQENDKNVNLKNNVSESEHLKTVDTVTIKNASQCDETKILLENSSIENNVDSDSTTNNELNKTEKPVKPLTRNELCVEQTDSLDINFGADEELFPENITSESVLDNINALIADLDNDIEAPKINDFNEKFINNIVGNIPSKEFLGIHKTDFTSDITLNETIEFDAQDSVESAQSSSSEKNKTDATKNTSNLEPVNTHTNFEKSLDDCKEINSKVVVQSGLPIPDSNATKVQEEVTENIQEHLKNNNSDATVSTTAVDGMNNEKVIVTQSTSGSNDPANCLFAPDSTINTHEHMNITDLEVTETCPDSTNECTSVINDDVTSTHTTHTISKEKSNANSICTDNVPGIDSIGKLLSILEDKNKIKELITMLGKDSGENEKIKKKLEKLSEIVLDEEENSGEAHNDVNEQNTYQHEERSKETVIESPSVQLSNKEKFTDKEIQNLDSDEVKSVEAKIIHTRTLSPKRDAAINNEKNIMNGQCKEFIEQENVSIDDKSIQNESVDEITNKGMDNNEISNSNDVAEMIVKEASKNDENNEHTNADEQATNTNEKENEDGLLLPSDLNTVPKKSKKPKMTKRGRSRLAKKLLLNKDTRVTRSASSNYQPKTPSVRKKPSRELLKLQEDIRDMFISDDILNATGIRMCRLAKMAKDKKSKDDLHSGEVETPEPIVILENINSKMSTDEALNSKEKINKKKAPKSKSDTSNEAFVGSESKVILKRKPGPKSKTKRSEDEDPYCFENDSIGESNNTVDSRDLNSDSESDSVSTKSFGSSELLVESKKKAKRKRGSWQLGVIKKKTVKNKTVIKDTENSIPVADDLEALETNDKIVQTIPDLNCFTDKSYCFYKHVKTYLCRLCGYRGNDIVLHYKKNHPHSEIPLSRLNPETAKYAIQECENMDIQALSKIQMATYVCRFCSQEFQKQHSPLESFFWHVVSVHTGEYKRQCSDCINIKTCPFNLDIPPPPKNIKGQLIGYICGRCNFTQVSLENLKTHVIIRHDDEQTEVYSINLSEIPKSLLKLRVKETSESKAFDATCLSDPPRILRSARSNPSMTEPSDDCSDITDNTDHMLELDRTRDSLRNIVSMNKIQSKLIFENDLSDTSTYSKNDEVKNNNIKQEKDDEVQDDFNYNEMEDALEAESAPEHESESEAEPHNISNGSANNEIEPIPPSDVLICPHFKIKLSDTGSKEYVCCINGIDNHYKTTLLISFKKHVQLKHSENWDGYCFVCKVIVTAQGKHTFRDCLQHFLDKHMDNFPIMEVMPSPIGNVSEPVTSTPIKDTPALSKTYLNVRPLSELIATERIETQEVNTSMPKIERVISLGSSNDPINSQSRTNLTVCNYEEAQAEILKNKHRVVLEAMLSPEKLIHVFKCAGRFCSYSTNNPEEALLHATTHQKIGGENALKCAYCNFDAKGNAIDLVMHVFKTYEYCPYSCSKCFYRGTVSLFVYAHIKRVHPEMDVDKVPVLSSTKVMKDNRKDDHLSRDTAVLYYVCNNRDPDEGGVCQFQTYVLTKFREHLDTKHENDPGYSCYICNHVLLSSTLLAFHLKSHGLRIYQCCRCLFGADNETDLKIHASEKHPFYLPKAYLRIITSKGGSADSRVLPLAILSKSDIETTVVTPVADGESPVKQAERSIDLEKLIGHTNSVIESMNTITNVTTIEPVEFTANQSQEIRSEQASCSLEVESGRTSPATLTLLKDSQILPSIPVVNVKSEPQENSKPTDLKVQTEIDETPEMVAATPNPDPDDVVCLDSDEDAPRHAIIDLSSDDTPSESNATKNQVADTSVKILRTMLYKCRKCYVVSKSEGMFKRHIISCFPNPNEEIKCLYCDYVTPANQIVNHYNNVHLKNNVTYVCNTCDSKFQTLILAKKHMKLVHNETSTLVSTKTYACGNIEYYICSDGKARQAPKRKLSGDIGSKNVEPAHKLKKYGPQDIDKLPINPILDNLVYCTLCEFNTKVRLNMVRHLQMHAEQQPVSRTAPVNPVPHLESNEKHFDKMLNLASSSITTGNKIANKDIAGPLTEHLSPEAAAIYPKYVSDRHRYTCGAKGCSYISVKESMFKIHWETLHAGTTDYHCVHCPSHQHLDTSKPLTAVRILTHLKMHDANLYACSSCTYYHYTRKLIEKHLKETHKGSNMIIVREGGVSLAPAPPAPVQSSAAPTMDLKPWQCGLCKFKSMLCPEVIEHCGKYHQSKMQFKCTYCGFRTSNIENISKHQSKQHPGKKEEVFYFYYREGSLADEADGTPRWQRQSQKIEPVIKTEANIPPSEAELPLPKPATPKSASPINLDIVKKEVVEPETARSSEESLEDLCKRFGQFCEPNGLNYKCSLCKVVVDTKEAMQSHLYEELQYRKWGCAVCSYKAFHKPGLQQHMQAEHCRGVPLEPVELQADTSIETWVAELIAHQTAIVNRNRENLAKQKAEILRPTADAPEKPPPEPPKPETPTMAALEKLFGSFGVPSNMNYSCPMCTTSARSEAVMQEHLEYELNKRRWHCNSCNEAFQTYHEAQFHCRSAHPGGTARPTEAARGSGLRAAWVAAVLRVQKLTMNCMPVTEPPPDQRAENPPQADTTSPENSLLVVRYEEKVPTPEELMKANKSLPTDAEKAAPEPEVEKKRPDVFKCSYCNATYKHETFFQGHVLKHYGLKPYTCPYCSHTDTKKAMESHINGEHPGRAVLYMNTRIPKHKPLPDVMNTPGASSGSSSKPSASEDEGRRICLVCEESMTKFESQSHFHNSLKPQFGFKGTLVYRCWTCLTLHKSHSDYIVHHKYFHPNEKKHTSFYKLDDETRTMYCSICERCFNNITSYRQHHQAAHGMKTTTCVIQLDEEAEASGKRKAEDDNIQPVAKRVARKSTTKLPNAMAVARKSTTKLPYDAPSDDEEYSYYGTLPTMDNLANVTTVMPFCNTFVPFSLKKLSEIIKINPKVIVKDINDKK